jgi:hypothetical protein
MNKYYVFPLIEGCNTGFPLFPEAVPLDAALEQISVRMELINKQGHWRDSHGKNIPTEYVSFHVVTEKEWDSQ